MALLSQEVAQRHRSPDLLQGLWDVTSDLPGIASKGKRLKQRTCKKKFLTKSLRPSGKSFRGWEPHVGYPPIMNYSTYKRRATSDSTRDAPRSLSCLWLQPGGADQRAETLYPVIAHWVKVLMASSSRVKESRLLGTQFSRMSTVFPHWNRKKKKTKGRQGKYHQIVRVKTRATSPCAYALPLTNSSSIKASFEPWSPLTHEQPCRHLKLRS